MATRSPSGRGRAAPGARPGIARPSVGPASRTNGRRPALPPSVTRPGPTVGSELAIAFDGLEDGSLDDFLALADDATGARIIDTLQAAGGNTAVQRIGAVAVQRVGMEPTSAHDPHLREARERDRLPDGYESLSDGEKIGRIRLMVGTKTPSAIGRAWSLLSDELGQARANPDLFAQCVKINDDILDHSGFNALREQFKKDVEQTALNNLAQNRTAVHEEMKATGVEALQTGKEPAAEQDFAVQDIQRIAPELERAKKAKAQMHNTRIGTKEVWTKTGREWDWRSSPATFDPAGPPNHYKPGEGLPTWDQINEQWIRVSMIEGAMIRQYPSAAYFLGPGGDPSKLTKTMDIKAARAEIAKALEDLAGRIDKAVPLVGDDLTFIDFPPIQQALLAGTASPSGANWSKPVEQAVAKEEVADANVANLLKTLGLATLGAALFILASIATAGGAAIAGAVLFAGGAAVGAGQAIASWDKYRDLATAQEATVDPELALVTGEQVDEAMFSAILDSVFAVLDVAQAAKAAYVGLKGGKAVLEAGKAGASVSLRTALRGIGKAAEPAKLIERAVAELGPETTSKLSRMSLEDMAKTVGTHSPLGQRLLKLGKAGLSDVTKALLDKLPKLGELSAAEGEQVLRASLEHYGILGTLKHGGGWAALKKASAMKTAAGESMEAWRKGLVGELQEYIAKESEQMSQAVRTGTQKASSDLDVQVVGGAASELQTKAEGWLAGRLGTDVKGAKSLLDAEIFIDPFRSHMIDIMKDLSPEIRKQIGDKMAAWERQLIFGARLKEAEKVSKEAVEKVLQEAKDAGVEPFREFRALTGSEQKALSGQIDGWMTELKGTTDAGKRAELVEKISKAQAHINASHADAYVGGGVRVWVTGREGAEAAADVETLAKALGMTPEELKAATAAQRLTAALAEAKWLDAAVSRLSKPTAASADDLPKLAKAVTDIGKHGGRAAGQLKAAGAPAAGALDSLFERLAALKAMDAEQLAARIQAGELPQINAQIDGLLSQLKNQTKAAVDALGAEVKAANIAGAELAEFQRLVTWQARYAILVDAAREATAAYVKLLHVALETRLQASLPEPQPNQSTVPAPDASTPPAGPAGI